MQVIYDSETYPNCYLAQFKPVEAPDDEIRTFEISFRRRDNYELWHYVAKLTSMVGFNNLRFDWIILDFFMRNPHCTAEQLYALANDIINGEDGHKHIIWKPEIEQIDLFLINGFDNAARRTSLKKLEFNMRCHNVANLPYRPGSHLDSNEIDNLITYGKFDVANTAKFFELSRPAIELRRAFNRPAWLNKSDIKLGRAYFEDDLRCRGVPTHADDRSALITTRPGGVHLGDIIFPYLQFQTETLRKVRDEVAGWTIRDIEKDGKTTRIGAPDDFSFEFAGVKVVMGLGGIHACADAGYYDGDQQEIIDIDVVSFYPSLTIANKIYPEHLGPTFCEVYASLLRRRLQTEKGTPENTILKLALNAVFGSSGSKYVCFYDPKYMLSVTINGQLLLLTLLEYLMRKCDGLKVLQLNTDGMTVIAPPGTGEAVREYANSWASAVHLKLEFAQYSRMWIRDVNNYIAEYAHNGKRKRKGVYEHRRQWHQNMSMPVVAMAAEAFMCTGIPIEQFIKHHNDPWDFMLRLDIKGDTRVVLDNGEEHKGILRYYVAEDGHGATKYTNKTTTRIHAGGYGVALGKRGKYECSICGATFARKGQRKGDEYKAGDPESFEYHNEKEHSSKLRIMQEYDGSPINPDYRFYINEAEKLCV